LQRDYNGQDEPYWHMVDEYYDYGATVVSDASSVADRFSLHQNFPNPVHQSTSINFQLPNNGHVLVEILNDNSNVIDVLVNSQLYSGDHSFSWDSSNYPSGLYFCRVHFAGLTRTRKMIVIH
jgi:flagellar hook assembly protein FlgD